MTYVHPEQFLLNFHSISTLRRLPRRRVLDHSIDMSSIGINFFFSPLLLLLKAHRARWDTHSDALAADAAAVFILRESERLTKLNLNEYT